MKKGYVLLVIMIMAFFVAGCMEKVDTKSSNEPDKSPAVQAGDNISVSTGGSSGGAVAVDKDAADTEPRGSKGAEVIVKSGSDVASKDKAALLDQIDQELDQMINDINNLEDISDSDLQ